MAIWYEVEQEEKSIKDFMESNYEFHDFRIETINYTAEKDCVDVFLKYDTKTEGVLLRFVGLGDIHIYGNIDYAADYIPGTSLFVQENGKFLWIVSDASENNIGKAKGYSTWLESEYLYWAITDGEGNPVEMPKEHIDQVWYVYDKKENKHFEFKPFTGDWKDILKPKW